jgi:uncharacterized membrane protein
MDQKLVELRSKSNFHFIEKTYYKLIKNYFFILLKVFLENIWQKDQNNA